MSEKVLHLNLLTAEEALPRPRALAKILLPALAGLALASVIGWGIVIGIQTTLSESRLRQVRAAISQHAAQSAACESLKAELRDLRIEDTQYGYYMSGRTARGEVLAGVAAVVPETVMLTSLALPPPEQPAQPPPGIPLPPLLGATQKVDRAEMRITGLAQDESGVFKLMESIRASEFTNFLFLAEQPVPGRENPRVLAFRQESAKQPGDPSGVFFDLVYDLKPREYVK